MQEWVWLPSWHCGRWEAYQQPSPREGERGENELGTWRANDNTNASVALMEWMGMCYGSLTDALLSSLEALRVAAESEVIR